MLLCVIIFIIVFIYALFARILFPKRMCKSFDITKTPFRELEMSKEDHNMLVSIMDRLNRLFKEENVINILIGGSLMGAMRYKNRMPWDDDIDLGIFDSDQFERLSFAKYGLSTRKVYFGYKVYDTVHNYSSRLEKTVPFIDIFIYDMIEPGVYFFRSQKARDMWPREKMSNIFPTSTCEFAGLLLSCPKNPKLFLNQAYPGWDKKAYIQGSHTGIPLTRNFEMYITDETTSQVLKYLNKIKIFSP